MRNRQLLITAFLSLALFFGSAQADGQWTMIGPQPLIGPDGESMTGTMMHSGFINAVAVDPQNASVVYLGTLGGGVWKTSDGGQTWVPLTDGQSSLQIGVLALDPTNPDTIYAGTNSLGFFGNMGAGILKSPDGGATWTQLPGPLPTGPGMEASVGGLAVSPSNGNVVLAVDASAGGAALYRSADGGNTWKEVIASSASPAQVLFDPSNGNIAYATTLGGVYKSTDGGNTWATANGTGANTLPAGTYYGLAIAPSSPQTLFVDTPNTASVQMYKSVDGAQNWTPLPGSPLCEGIQVDPANPNLVFAGAGGIFQSTDGGVSWTLLYGGGGAHAGIAFSADGSILYLGGEWGAWKATGLANSSLTLTDLNATLAITPFDGIAIHPTDPTIALGGAQAGGVEMYSGTLTWQDVDCDDGGADGAFDFMNPTTIYATCITAPGVIKSTDGGATFSYSQSGIDASELTPDIAPALAMDPANSQRLYFAAAHVWQSNDGADTWTSISGVLGGDNVMNQALAVAPSDSNTVYLGNSMGVYVSTNAASGSGATWSNISAGLPFNLAQCNYYGPTCVYLSRVAVDFSNASTAYATFENYASGHVYKTTNNGGSWTDISGNLPNLKVNDIAVDPDVPNTLYIATEQGVYSTADGGNTWNLLGTGLPNVAVTAVKLHRPTRILRAATFGRSVWDLHLGAVASPVALSPTSLSFQNQGPAQTVTLTNNGTAPLTLYSVTPPSGFSQTNNCGIQIKAGGNCAITVSFTANESGTISGEITLSDDAPGEPQSLAVSGTGAGAPDFSLDIASGSSSSTTITAGHTGTYSLNVIPEGGFNQTVSLACSGAPSEATCSVSPSFATLDGTDPAAITVSVTTTAPSLAMRRPHSGPANWGDLRITPLTWACLLALIAILVVSDLRRAQRRVPFLPRFALGLVILRAGAWVACGGSAGGGGGGTGGGNPGTPSGTYTITVTGSHPSGSTPLTHNITLTLTVS